MLPRGRGGATSAGRNCFSAWDSGKAGRLAGRPEEEPFSCTTGNSCAAGKGEAGTSAEAIDPLDFAERIGPGATYAWLYPNFMLNWYEGYLDTNLVLPRYSGS